MKKLQFYLSGFLALQLVLAAGLFWREHRQQELQQQSEPLLALQQEQLQRLEISADDNSVTLQKNAGEWQLPELHSLPVDAAKLDGLLDKLAEMRSGWPVATTSSARERFEVGEEKFQKRLRLYSDGEVVAEFFIGTSPGFRWVHLRRAGDDAIYAVELNSYEMPAKGEEWLDKKLLAAGEPESISGPDYQLRKVDGEWQFVAGDGELDVDKARELASAFSGLRIQKPAEEMPEAEPLEIRVATGGGELSYQFLRADEKYFVRRSDREQLFELSRYDYERIADLRRPQLVRTSEAEGESQQTAEGSEENEEATKS
ncbi:DUF4340 domain-containing protein [Microbulbifer rhizosphaerae]|uniref:DUF4340 domain-containing protein n=1 Tax=Microbulbifer rhizosphaerae TaxID=1562603 RepID=A0A7W4WCE2_9GAMM|nr:DUF4340 domain-containing protein [Microbulbifer rhizosphaerae]MBB3061132.1 hypothetical protein [Microbulbifer rhizosphaerae]